MIGNRKRGRGKFMVSVKVGVLVIVGNSSNKKGYDLSRGG